MFFQKLLEKPDFFELFINRMREGITFDVHLLEIRDQVFHQPDAAFFQRVEIQILVVESESGMLVGRRGFDIDGFVFSDQIDVAVKQHVVDLVLAIDLGFDDGPGQVPAEFFQNVGVEPFFVFALDHGVFKPGAALLRHRRWGRNPVDGVEQLLQAEVASGKIPGKGVEQRRIKAVFDHAY